MQHKRFILENGLRVIAVPMPGIASVTVMVLVGAGSRYEKRSTSGISHFLEHMAFKGTEKRPSALGMASLIEGVGGDFNAFTGKEVTGFHIKAQNTQLELCMDVLSDILQNSLFDPIEIKKEVGVVIEEINMYEDSPMQNLGIVYERLLYGDTPLGWDTGGFKDVLKKVNREDFLKYLKTYYSSDNMTVVVAGGVTPEHVKKVADTYFGSLKQFDTPKLQLVSEKQDSPRVFIKRQKTEQVHLSIGFRTVGLGHPDQYALDVLATIMGGGMSSRLFGEVREKHGLGYYVRTTSDNYLDCGTIVTSAGVDKKKAYQAVEILLKEIKKIAMEGVTAEELQNAKEMMNGHFVLELEDSHDVASFYAHEEILEKELLTPEDVIEKTNAVTLEQVNAAAAKYLIKETLNLAIIGNFASSETFEEMAKAY